MSIDETLKAREKEYGDYNSKACTIQSLKDIIRLAPNWKTMRASHMESLDMIVHKIGRILHGNPDSIDSWHDIQGYAKLVERRLIEEQLDTSKEV